MIIIMVNSLFCRIWQVLEISFTVIQHQQIHLECMYTIQKLSGKWVC